MDGRLLLRVISRGPLSPLLYEAIVMLGDVERLAVGTMKSHKNRTAAYEAGRGLLSEIPQQNTIHCESILKGDPHGLHEGLVRRALCVHFLADFRFRDLDEADNSSTV